jgi:hypothetical protein
MSKEKEVKEEKIEMTPEQARENREKIMEKITKMQESGLLGKAIDPLEGVDISSEYELVIAKQSKLSANKRKMVCARHAYFQEEELRREELKAVEATTSNEEE